MNHHLSADQIARCFAGARDQQQHLMECPECRAELDRFAAAIASFRDAIRDRVDRRAVAEPFVASRVFEPPASVIPKWVFAAAATVVFALGLLPLLTSERMPRKVVDESAFETDPNALMNAVNMHLLRTVPAPMEPMFALVPAAQRSTELGGIR